VLSFILKVYKNIIEIDNIANIDKTYQCFINIGLKSCRRVRKPKRHNDIFVMSVTDKKCHFLFVALTDSNTVISIPKIEFREYFNPA
jgi:hypothetical protein